LLDGLQKRKVKKEQENKDRGVINRSFNVKYVLLKMIKVTLYGGHESNV